MTYLVVEGELTIHTAAEQKDRLMSALAEGTGLRIDLSGVTDVDTAGLQVLLLVEREAARHGVAVEHHEPSPAVREVFAVAHIPPVPAEA
jgi:anti-sigma B factor antagonist